MAPTRAVATIEGQSSESELAEPSSNVTGFTKSIRSGVSAQVRVESCGWTNRDGTASQRAPP